MSTWNPRASASINRGLLVCADHRTGHPISPGSPKGAAVKSPPQSPTCASQIEMRAMMMVLSKVSAVVDKSCRAGENRSQISRMALWPHRHSCSGGKQSGSGWAEKQVGKGGEGNGTLHILLICDLFPPALQFLSTAALTLANTVVSNSLSLNVAP